MSQFEMKPANCNKTLLTIFIMVVGKFCFADDRLPASINRGVSAIATPSRIFYGHDGEAISPELIATFNKIQKSQEKVDASKFIPTDLAPSNNSTLVFSRVADRCMQTFFNSVEFRQSAFGSATIAVEESLKTEVTVAKAHPNSVEHRLKFDVQAFQTLAQIRYSGVTNAAIRYFANTETLTLEVAEKIFARQQLVLGHSIQPTNRISHMSMQWSF